MDWGDLIWDEFINVKCEFYNNKHEIKNVVDKQRFKKMCFSDDNGELY